MSRLGLPTGLGFVFFFQAFVVAVIDVLCGVNGMFLICCGCPSYLLFSRFWSQYRLWSFAVGFLFGSVGDVYSSFPRLDVRAYLP